MKNQQSVVRKTFRLNPLIEASRRAIMIQPTEYFCLISPAEAEHYGVRDGDMFEGVRIVAIDQFPAISDCEKCLIAH